MKNLKTDSKKTLLLAIGNCGRGDDGLGWAFADGIKELGCDFLDYEYRYQLQIEDTCLISGYDRIIFADASHSLSGKGFEMKTCSAAHHYFFSSHIQSPETILYLAADLYDKHPEAFLLAIKGEYWELKTTLSKTAEKNLQSALRFFVNDFLPASRLLQIRQKV